MTDMLKVWLEDAEEHAIAGTRAEKACKIIRELHALLDKVGGCETCTECTMYAEDVIERVDDIVEEI